MTTTQAAHAFLTTFLLMGRKWIIYICDSISYEYNYGFKDFYFFKRLCYITSINNLPKSVEFYIVLSRNNILSFYFAYQEFWNYDISNTCSSSSHDNRMKFWLRIKFVECINIKLKKTMYSKVVDSKNIAM